MKRQQLTWGLALGFSAIFSMGNTPQQEPREPLTVMTWNLYVGADTAEILASPTLEAMAARADAAWKTMEATRFNERVLGIVDQIEAQKPHLIGLQEVSLLRFQSPGDRFHGGMEPATEVAYDFEKILLTEIAARGLEYRVVARVQNGDVEVPRANASGDDVRLTDHDIILARADVSAEADVSGNYQAALTLPFPDGKSMLTVTRGYTSARVQWLGQEALFVNTHLEISAFAALQRLQAAELMNQLSTRSEPILLVGDFNSSPVDGEASSYQLLVQSGFRDVWNDRVDKQEEGLTCCQAADLSNKDSTLQERIDLILVKNEEAWLAREVEAMVIGDEPEDQTPSGLWPSDHAGVIAQFSVK